MRWRKKEISPQEVQALRSRLDVDALTASILLRRGVATGEEAMYYLEDDPRYLHSPFLFKEMEDAVDRILAARDEGEKVLVFGDRDADGITGAALLAGALAGIGIEAEARLPEGDDPYGLSIAAVEDFASRDGTLIITVDNGISCLAEAARAAELGVDLIIVDHHNPPQELPLALATINPKVEGSGYPFRDLCGCAVAYKLAQALRFALSGPYKEEVCLLNVRPVNEAMAVEAVAFSNMAASARIAEFVVPGTMDLSRTRLIPFLKDKRIVVWDAPLQRRLLAKVFGSGVEIAMYDIRDEVAQAMPQTKGMSLLRLREVSRMARYRPPAEGGGEIETFESIFLSFIQRSAKTFTEADEGDLQLVALGTIADMMPLRNENRILVKRGLRALGKKPRPGLAELLSALDSSGRRMAPRFSARDVSFQITPVINAAGRMGRPRVAYDLLTSSEPARRERLAAELDSMNKERRQLGEDAWLLVKPEAEASLGRYAGNLALAFGKDLHRGITGIMATRIAKALGVPAIVCAALGDGSVVGSVRSARGLDVRSFLESCADILDDFGGHDFAAGFSLGSGRLEALLERLTALAPAIELGSLEAQETVDLDAELPLDYLKPEVLEVADRFEPSGENSSPVTFLTRGMGIKSMDIMGKREPMHLRLTLDSGAFKWPAVYWQAAERAGRDFKVGDRVDVVFSMGRDGYSGTDAPRLMVTDMEKSEPKVADRT